MEVKISLHCEKTLSVAVLQLLQLKSEGMKVKNKLYIYIYKYRSILKYGIALKELQQLQHCNKMESTFSWLKRKKCREMKNFLRSIREPQ